MFTGTYVQWSDDFVHKKSRATTQFIVVGLEGSRTYVCCVLFGVRGLLLSPSRG